jgi:hypothetical protein
MSTTLSLRGIHVNVEAAYGVSMAQPVITPTQARMARAALRLGVREVGELSGISPATIVRVERETVAPTLGTMVTLRTTYEQAGIEFADDDGVFDRRKKRGISIEPTTKPQAKGRSEEDST